MKNQVIFPAVARYLSALILVQTLFFKFSASPESVYIFQTVGMEPWGRIMVGVAELIAALLLIYKPLSWLGSILSIFMMAGAIMMHVFLIGIEVMGDGGELFLLAVVVFILCSYVLYEQRAIWLDLLRNRFRL
ncbi:DoxX family protein [Chryseotalea sanaruensis]|uniref:DoxX family protein n=1 Tax=Chryseotalea sanaruensis TaxID=2482724 RepID=A0A401U4P7_9BACT|nr:DoxX family protein [Chryseotalea sanaruensis]GCC49888.1 DoxX family protein [Chryseotalea sanaruensis]